MTEMEAHCCHSDTAGLAGNETEVLHNHLCDFEWQRRAHNDRCCAAVEWLLPRVWGKQTFELSGWDEFRIMKRHCITTHRKGYSP